MKLGLSTAFAASVGWDPARMIDLLQRSGAAGVELDAQLPAPLLEALATLLGRGELPVWAIENVCPAGPLANAQLASLERDESDAALAAATATLRKASEVGASWVVLNLGEVRPLRKRWPALRRAFLRDELDEDRRESLALERQKLGVAHLDPIRRTLERLAHATRQGEVLALRNPPRPTGLPSPAELKFLLDDLRGAPVCPLWDVPAAHLADGFGVPFASTAAAFGTAPLVHLADATGAVAGLARGAGEIDLRSVPLAAGAHVIYTPWNGYRSEEVLAAHASLS